MIGLISGALTVSYSQEAGVDVVEIRHFRVDVAPVRRQRRQLLGLVWAVSFTIVASLSEVSDRVERF